MKLGKLTALWLCWELWDWLAKNPDEIKSDWPQWKQNRGKYKKATHYCFACEYRIKIKKWKHECPDNSCIIPCFRGLSEDGDGYSCYDEKSSFQKWNEGIDNKRNARIIADSAYKEYVKLGGKKRK